MAKPSGIPWKKSGIAYVSQLRAMQFAIWPAYIEPDEFVLLADNRPQGLFKSVKEAKRYAERIASGDVEPRRGGI